MQIFDCPAPYDHEYARTLLRHAVINLIEVVATGGDLDNDLSLENRESLNSVFASGGPSSFEFDCYNLLAEIMQERLFVELKAEGISFFEYLKPEFNLKGEHRIHTAKHVNCIYKLENPDQPKFDGYKLWQGNLDTKIFVAYPALDNSIALKEYYTEYSACLSTNPRENSLNTIFDHAKNLYAVFVTEQKAKWIATYEHAQAICDLTRVKAEGRTDVSVLYPTLRLFAIRSPIKANHITNEDSGSDKRFWYFSSIQSYSVFLSEDPSPLELTRFPRIEENSQSHLEICRVYSPKN